MLQNQARTHLQGNPVHYSTADLSCVASYAVALVLIAVFVINLDNKQDLLEL